MPVSIDGENWWNRPPGGIETSKKAADKGGTLAGGAVSPRERRHRRRLRIRGLETWSRWIRTGCSLVGGLGLVQAPAGGPVRVGGPCGIHADKGGNKKQDRYLIVAARDPHFFPEQGLAAHRPDVLLLFEAEHPDHVERVDAWMDRKVEALLRHRSQWRSTMGIDDRPEEQQAAFVTRLHDAAQHEGVRAGVRAGEAFRTITNL